jgi:hypothetical protein
MEDIAETLVQWLVTEELTTPKFQNVRTLTGDVMSLIFDGTPPHAGHRRPYQAGADDYYYRRACVPNFSLFGQRIEESNMNSLQIEEYRSGYKDEQDKKVMDESFTNSEEQTDEMA